MMLTWMWMEMTLWSMGNHSILGVKWGKPTVTKVAGTSKTSSYSWSQSQLVGAGVHLRIQSPCVLLQPWVYCP